MQSAKFLEGLSGKLAERWTAALLTPAFVFWGGGLLVGVQHHGWGKAIRAAFDATDLNFQLLTILIMAFLVVSTSAAIVQRFEFATIRFLEGYWPGWLKGIRHWATYRKSRQFKQDGDRWQTLKLQQISQGLAPEDESTLARLEHSLRRVPVQPQQLMPTQMGNILRAAELRPNLKYGLDAVVCWPHLWLLLPEQARADLNAARQTLNTGARVWLWSLLFALVWTPFGLLRWSGNSPWPTVEWSIWALWPAVLGLLSIWFAYSWMLEAAGSYGDLIEAAFDLYRHALYMALRWPLPTSSADEKTQGRQLTQYLWRGTVGNPVQYQPPLGQ